MCKAGTVHWWRAVPDRFRRVAVGITLVCRKREAARPPVEGDRQAVPLFPLPPSRVFPEPMTMVFLMAQRGRSPVGIAAVSSYEET